MSGKRKLLSREFDTENILNWIIYSTIIIMPFIVIREVRPYYVTGKVLYLYIIFFAVVLCLIKLKIKFKYEKEEMILFAFLLSLIISTVLSIDKKTSIFGWDGRFEGLAIYAVYLLLFIASLYYFKQYKNSINVLSIIGSLMAIYSILEYYGVDPICKYLFNTTEKIDMIGTIGNRNFLSTYILLFLILSLSIYIMKNEKRFLIYSSILFGGILVTYTRSGWLSFVIVTIIGYFLVRKKKDILRRISIVVIVFFLVFMGLEVSGRGGFVFRFNTIISDMVENPENAGSGRVQIWSITLKAIKENPIMGSGLDTLQLRLIRDNFGGYYNYFNDNGVFIDKAHNEFLEYWACGGILTLISYVALIGVILTKLFKRREDDGCKIYFLMILGYVIQSFFNISVPGVAPLYWILLGAAVKHYRDLDKAKAVQAIAD